MIEPKSQVKKCSAHAEILQQNEERTVYRLRETDGEVRITSYPVFPGIELAYHDVHAPSYPSGRAECGGTHRDPSLPRGTRGILCGGEHYFFPRTTSLSCAAPLSRGRWSSPRGHYHGITVTIDPARAPDCLSCFLEDVEVRPSALIEKFCADGACFVTRSSPGVAHIFSELYSVPEGIRKGYFKVKILELLLFLSAFPIQAAQPQHGYSLSQVQLAEQIGAYLLQNTERRLTVAELSRYFGASATLINSSFRGVYGMSPAAFLRAQKMHGAARLLRRTDRTVLDIAGQFGYDNGSKFAKAFRDVIGVSPNAYRSGIDCDSCAPEAPML